MNTSITNIKIKPFQKERKWKGGAETEGGKNPQNVDKVLFLKLSLKCRKKNSGIIFLYDSVALTHSGSSIFMVVMSCYY